MVEENDNFFEACIFKQCSEKKSGTSYITTNKNRSCQVIIIDGLILAVTIGKQMGFSAVIKLRAEGIKAFSFKEHFQAPYKDEAIIESTREVLEFLGDVSIKDNDETIINEEIKEPNSQSVKMYRGNIIED